MQIRHLPGRSRSCGRAFGRRPAVLVPLLLAVALEATAALQVTDVRGVPSQAVPQFSKVELSFQVPGTQATRMQWPYDPAPPGGIPAGVGISADAVFRAPDGRQFVQPAFHAEQFVQEVRDGRDWHLPTGAFQWMVRFSPHVPGAWSVRIVARDRSGVAESPTFTFTVAPGTGKGFVRVSRADSRYFEFDNGEPFLGLGFQFPAFLDNPVTRGTQEYAALAARGVDFVRVWVSSMFGSAWSTWIGGRNQYRGYLPIIGLTPFRDVSTGETTLTMKLDYEPEGDTGWFDACRMQLWWEDQAESIKPYTRYRIRVQYRGYGIAGPRDPRYPQFGLVAKLGGWHADCYEPGTSTVVTGHGTDNAGFGFIEGDWDSGAEHFLPRMYLALENVRQGAAWVQSVSLREHLGDGTYGPELMRQPSMEHQLYVPEEKAFALDKVVELAERHGVYLKLVVMEKNDEMYLKMADNGDWVDGADNAAGFYGTGRVVNKTRWLQQVWWRYLQARWGYSPNIHSWELTNEGDPASVRHYELADEFGKFMACRAFGVEPGAGGRCQLGHPNAHMVTTSFWHSFPAPEFWSNATYPNVDYADVHAYVSTSFAPLSERATMQWDAAHYHLWHSQHLASLRVGKPVVRGEAGLDATNRQEEDALRLDRDAAGVWLHNYLWSGLDSGGLYELYWWNSHIWRDGIDHRREYAAFRKFLEDVPRHKGGFVDWGGTVSNGALRVVGQKHVAAGWLHLWVQNRQHTWKNVVDGVAIAPATGEIVVPGFRPGATYTLQRWNTREPATPIASTELLTADPSGNLRVGVSSLRDDVALKVGGAPRTPTGLRIVP